MAERLNPHTQGNQIEDREKIDTGHELLDLGIKIALCMGADKAARFRELIQEYFYNLDLREGSEEESRESMADVVARSKLPEKEDPDNPTIFIAQDVLLIDSNGQEIHKPTGDSQLKIADELSNILCSDEELIKLKFRIGLAVGVSQQKGMSFHKIVTFKIKPFSREEINDYVLNRDLDFLKKTNGGCRWENPIFMNNIIEVEGVRREDDNFGQVLDDLIMAAKGVYPYYIEEIKQAIEFIIENDDVDGRSIITEEMFWLSWGFDWNAHNDGRSL